MPQIDFMIGLFSSRGFAGQQALQLPSGPWLPATRQDALVVQPRRGLHVGHAIAEARL